MNVLEEYRTIPDTTILDSFCKADDILNKKGFRKIAVSISGGSDSDIVLDICRRIGRQNNYYFIWFDTGLEYQASKDHLKELEKKYEIQILRRKAFRTIPLCCKMYGQPFLSKQVSTNIDRLQRNGFRWEDAPYEYLIKKYPDAASSIRWWCNKYSRPDYKSHSIFSIGRNKGLKEFLISNPPWFRISNKCCAYAKKATAKIFFDSHPIDLSITGVRKAEGGIRSAAYKGCCSFDKKTSITTYRPIFWYSSPTKDVYADYFGVSHSRCYRDYGLTRTGCVGCPCNRHLDDEIDVIRQNEPKLLSAAEEAFRDSYEYTKMYREFLLQISGEKATLHGVLEPPSRSNRATLSAK